MTDLNEINNFFSLYSTSRPRRVLLSRSSLKGSPQDDDKCLSCTLSPFFSHPRILPPRVFRSRCTFPDATGSHVAIETCTADACARSRACTCACVCVRFYVGLQRRYYRNAELCANTIIITPLIVTAN